MGILSRPRFSNLYSGNLRGRKPLIAIDPIAPFTTQIWPFFILSTNFLVTLSAYHFVFFLPSLFLLPVPFFSQPSGRLPSRDKTRQGSDRILYTKWLGGESPAVSETEASRRRKGRKPWKGEKKRIERKTINNLAKR